MRPKELINHQVVREPIVGKENIRKMFESDFSILGHTVVSTTT
jgi:hypothetical protein